MDHTIYNWATPHLCAELHLQGRLVIGQRLHRLDALTPQLPDALVILLHAGIIGQQSVTLLVSWISWHVVSASSH